MTFTSKMTIPRCPWDSSEKTFPLAGNILIYIPPEGGVMMS